MIGEGDDGDYRGLDAMERIEADGIELAALETMLDDLAELIAEIEAAG